VLLGNIVRNSGKQKYVELAKQKGWSFAYADGYLDGLDYRRRRMKPSHYLLMGVDEYAQGFRAGYSVGHKAPRSA
jgi:hypothetical protein